MFKKIIKTIANFLRKILDLLKMPYIKIKRELAYRKRLKELKKRDCDMVWCNARLVAVNFYKSVGFKITGELFGIEGIGPHYYMYKEI